MTDKKCPICKLINPPSAMRCDCGYDFESDTLQQSFADFASETNAKNRINNITNDSKIDLVALIVRSAIMGGIFSPITQGNYLEGFLFQSALGSIVAIILYGLEKLSFNILSLKINVKPLFAAGYRGAALLFVMSLIKFNDPARAVGSAVSGVIFGLILYIIERSILKPFNK